MQDMDGLIAQCLERNPHSLKRLREVAWEEIWAAGGDHVPDFSKLPKEIWGMIAARCDVSRATLTTLMLLNKERISEAVWTHFRFPSTWDYHMFLKRFSYDQDYRNAPGWTKTIWGLFGCPRAYRFFEVLQQKTSRFVADFVWIDFTRSDLTIDTFHTAMCAITNKNDVLKCLTVLLRSYRPCTDYETIWFMFKNIGCTVDDEVEEIDQKTPLKLVPLDLEKLKAPLTNIHIALGYYNAYREYARADYGVRLPKIELKGD